MKLSIILSTAIVLTTIIGCIKHEVIPAPEHKATLKAYFNGVINNSTTEYTENVVGYYGKATKSQILLPAGQNSSVVYLFEMKSDQTTAKMQIGLGSLNWDAANSTGPDLTTFNNFFNTNLNPAYSDNGASGFYVTYTDNVGNVWTSKANSTYAQSVSFSSLSQESDPNGDYSKFTCTFSCYAYRTYGSPAQEDSVLIQNAQIKGWFQR
ncbi:MAG: hypothetical protein HYR91_00370 [Flavobacteriia bacterium]|nr:hypothetical protein [Flavobacteriia bacterium]